MEVPNMDVSWIWKGIVIVLAGTVLLRIAGRKSISQMTLPQTVLTIAIGSLLIQPVASHNIWITIGVGAVLILTILILEYVQLKSDAAEKLIAGGAKTVIVDGEMKLNEMKSLRLTKEQLENQLRRMNVARVSDVAWATFETNGRIGFLLKTDAQPATKQDIIQLQQRIDAIMDQLHIHRSDIEHNEVKKNLFRDVARQDERDES